jgi:uncharacterized membrane protein
MEPEAVICPICGESDNATQVFKMYADLLDGSPSQEIQGIAKKQLTIFVSPPTIVKNGGISSLHPDLLTLILFIIFAYLFTIRLVEKGSYTFIFGLGIGVLLIAYGLFRQKLLAIYNQNKHDREKSISELRAKADIWMEMVYCIKDDLVFTPDHKIQLKLDQLRGYWLKQTRDQG